MKSSVKANGNIVRMTRGRPAAAPAPPCLVWFNWLRPWISFLGSLQSKGLPRLSKAQMNEGGKGPGVGAKGADAGWGVGRGADPPFLNRIMGTLRAQGR